jgi:hypothetical protein
MSLALPNEAGSGYVLVVPFVVLQFFKFLSPSPDGQAGDKIVGAT